jgi:hypothetical protein
MRISARSVQEERKGLTEGCGEPVPDDIDFGLSFNLRLDFQGPGSRGIS